MCADRRTVAFDNSSANSTNRPTSICSFLRRLGSHDNLLPNERALVSLDGTKSHSHYSDPGPEVSGTIVSYKWTSKENIDGKVVKRVDNNKSGMVEAMFPTGKTTFTLEVVDSTGGVAKDTAVVEVRASTANGAYCYSYDFGDCHSIFDYVSISQQLRGEPKPLFGGRTDRIDFQRA